MCKIIFMDLDGTLLNSEKSISQKNLDALSRCREKDILIAIATSRSESASQRILDIVKPDIVISNGGSRIRVFGEVIAEILLSKDEVRKIAILCQQAMPKEDFITCETPTGYYSNLEFDEYNPDYTDTKIINILDLDTEAYKMAVVLDCDETAEKIANQFENVSTHGYVGENWYRFAKSNSNKKNGVKIACDYLGIDVSQAIAFGDDINDLGMIKLCGRGVAMGNSIPIVSSSADYITKSCDEDGIAYYIEKFILLNTNL